MTGIKNILKYAMQCRDHDAKTTQARIECRGQSVSYV